MIVELINDLKSKGIKCAAIKEGQLVYSSFQVDKSMLELINKLFLNTSNFLSLFDSNMKEIQLIGDTGAIFIVEKQGYYIFSILKNKEQKKILREAL